MQAKSAALKNDVQQVATAWGAAVDAFNKAQERKRPPSSNTPPVPGGGYGAGGYGGMGRY